MKCGLWLFGSVSPLHILAPRACVEIPYVRAMKARIIVRANKKGLFVVEDTQHEAHNLLKKGIKHILTWVVRCMFMGW